MKQSDYMSLKILKKQWFDLKGDDPHNTVDGIGTISGDGYIEVKITLNGQSKKRIESKHRSSITGNMGQFERCDHQIGGWQQVNLIFQICTSKPR
jgi:hypothetical protein